MSSTRDRLVAISEWLDFAPVNADRSADEQLFLRTMKVGEEYGEVVAALIGMTGQNPRKGITHNRGDVLDELLDVAITALGAVEHMTGNEGQAFPMLYFKIDKVHARMLESSAMEALQTAKETAATIPLVEP